ncbi:MAG: putative pilN [Parcubacteria bacterium C7867-002]|nr:MAG: putative pilN [Parcubacteria bacterium C7867-002]
METKFQTSFIPKKPVSPTGMAGNVPVIRRAPSSIVMTLATVIFILSIAAAGGLYAWKFVLIADQKSYKEQLSQRQEQFDLGLIRDLKQVNVQINTARQLMANHLAISQVFESLGRLTVEKVRFSNMELSTGTGANTGSDIKITMKGTGLDLSTVAFQSQVLGELEQYGLRDIIKNPILSDPTEDDKNVVSFDFSASMNPQTLLYSKSVTPSAAPTDVNPQP